MATDKVTTRRTALIGLTAMAVNGSSPAKAADGAPPADGELLALREPLERLAGLEQAVAGAVELAREALDRFEDERTPSGLLFRPGDTQAVLDHIRTRVGMRLTPVDALFRRYSEWQVGEMRPLLIAHDHAVATGRPARLPPVAAERMREIIAAQDGLSAAVEVSEECLRANQLGDELRQISTELNMLIDRVRSLRATTFAGLWVKFVAAAAAASEPIDAFVAALGSEIASAAGDVRLAA